MFVYTQGKTAVQSDGDYLTTLLSFFTLATLLAQAYLKGSSGFASCAQALTHAHSSECASSFI